MKNNSNNSNHSNNSNNSNNNSRFHKIWLGGTLSLMEGIFGGYGMEQLKILKQNSSRSYYPIYKNYTNKFKMRGLMYRGYFPWGSVQAFTKGLPVLFVSSEVSTFLSNNKICSKKKSLIPSATSMGPRSMPSRCFPISHSGVKVLICFALNELRLLISKSNSIWTDCVFGLNKYLSILIKVGMNFEKAS